MIERIRAALSIEGAWALLGLSGRPAPSCCSPLPLEKRASLGIYVQGGWQRWFDHGLAQGGDVVDLWASARDLSISEAISDIITSVPGLGLDSGAFEPKGGTIYQPEAQNAPYGIQWHPVLFQ